MPKHVISPGQGLLLLMNHYKKYRDIVEQLKKLYLSGAANVSQQEEIKSLLEDKILEGYQISYDASVINDDPTRRYFETHLSYETLRENLDKIEMATLTRHVDALIEMLSPEQVIAIDYILKGEAKYNDSDLIKEYADYIAKIKFGKIFEEFTVEDRAKIELIVKSSFLVVQKAEGKRSNMPLDIYGKGFFWQGKVVIEGQETTRNQNMGLMKGHMPLALDDVARGEQAIPLLKPSDQATFEKDTLASKTTEGSKMTEWSKMSFAKMVHPFSNSISGTMLIQLRSIAELRKNGATALTDSAEQMARYIQLLISAMIFGSGGHSLHEFIAPLLLPETRYEFQTIPEFEKISLESMFLTGNEAAFDSALAHTIAYNAMILKRQQLHAQIKGEATIEQTNQAHPDSVEYR